MTPTCPPSGGSNPVAQAKTNRFSFALLFSDRKLELIVNRVGGRWGKLEKVSKSNKSSPNQQTKEEYVYAITQTNAFPD